MKLRLRSADSGETTRVEIPAPSTHLQFRQSIADRLSFSCSSLCLSLNKRDELVEAFEPADSFRSLGIASGDLVFYRALNQPEGFTVSLVNESSKPRDVSVSEGSGDFVIEDGSPLDLGDAQLKLLPTVTEGGKPSSTHGTTSSCQSNAMDEDDNGKTGSSSDLGDTHAICGPLVEKGKLETLGGGVSQTEGSCSGNPVSSNPGHHANHDSDASLYGQETVPNSILGFLSRVFAGEAENLKRERDLFIVSIHAAMLESGFWGRLPDRWSSESTVSISYSPSDLLARSDAHNIATLKIESFPDHVVVYGRLSGTSSELQRISLRLLSYGPSIRALLQQQQETNYSRLNYHKRLLFALWKEFKDNVSLPLLHELCDRTGLQRPACLGCIPSELKLNILARLAPIDLAKIECVSVEFMSLPWSNDLWRKKYKEVFGSIADNGRSWRKRFGESWALRKSRETTAELNSRTPMWYPVPSPQRAPISGGDYDRFPFPLNPFSGGSSLYGINGRNPGSHPRRRLANPFFCNLNN